MRTAVEGRTRGCYRVAAAPFGGPIAAIRDDRRPVPLGPSGSVSTAAPQLRTYSCARPPPRP